MKHSVVGRKSIVVLSISPQTYSVSCNCLALPQSMKSTSTCHYNINTPTPDKKSVVAKKCTVYSPRPINAADWSDFCTQNELSLGRLRAPNERLLLLDVCVGRRGLNPYLILTRAFDVSDILVVKMTKTLKSIDILISVFVLQQCNKSCKCESAPLLSWRRI